MVQIHVGQPFHFVSFHLHNISSALSGVRNTFVKIIIAHHHRRGAATGEALDEFHGELSVRRRLRAVLVRIQTEFLAKMFAQFIRATKRATQCAANFDLIFAHRLLPQHRIKRQDFLDVDRLQFQFFRRPLNRFPRNPAELFLDRVQHHERRRALHGIMRDQLVHFRFQICCDGKTHFELLKRG